MTNNIVNTNVTQTIAPAPNTLQGTGALVSQGATSTVSGTRTLLTQPSDLTAILAGALALTSLTWASSVVTAVTAAPHGYTIGDVIELTIAGAIPTGFNGIFACTITSTTGFTYPLASTPGSETTPGTYTPADVAELLAQVTTFFAQGVETSVYVLELGAGSAAEGVAALQAYLVANPLQNYLYMVPREWANESTYWAFLANYEATTSMVYFYTTVTQANYSNFTALMKCVRMFIEAPSIPVTEFSAAADFYVELNRAPTNTNMVTPAAFSEVTGVTPYPAAGNNALFTTLKAANVNWFGTGAEGGIANAILFWGRGADGRDFTYWYSVDWVQININLDLSNEIINGSNNPQSPLYYNQPGINRLTARAQQTMNRGVTFGMVLGPVTVTAVPFATYVSDNPSDFPKGVYNGLAVTYTPARGFTSITFNINVTDFPVS